MLCLSQKILLLFTRMTLPGLLASCARQDGDIPKIPTLSYVSYPYLKSHAVWALYLLHTENEKKLDRSGLSNDLIL